MISDPQRLESIKAKLRSAQSMLEMLKGNTTKEDIAKLRKEWVEPVEKEIKELLNVSAS